MRKVFTILFMTCFGFYSNAQDAKALKKLNSDFQEIIYSDFELAYQLASKAVEQSEALGDEYWMMQSYSNLSHIYYLRKQKEQAIVFAKKALAIALEKEDAIQEAILYNRLASIFRNKDKYVEALDYYEKALKIAKSNKAEYLASEIHKNLSILYRSKDIEQSFREARKAIHLIKEKGNSLNLADNYNLLGVLFFRVDKDSSIFFLNQSLEISRAIGNKYMEGTTLSNLADIYINKKDFVQAFSMLFETEKVFESIDNRSGLHYINMSFGNYYEHIDDFAMAIKKYHKAIHEYGDYVDGNQKLNAYYTIAGAYEDSNDFETAYRYQTVYLDLKDSLFTVEKSKEFDELRTQYEVRQKNDKIALLKSENDLARTQKKWGVMTGFVLLSTLLLLLFFYRHRMKTQEAIRKQENIIYQKEKDKLEQEQELVQVKALIEGQDKERNRIAKELHDGIAGQLAGVNLGLSHVNSNLGNEEIRKITDALSNTFKDLRSLSHRLSSNYHMDKDFETLLAELKRYYENMNAFDLEISIYPLTCLHQLDQHVRHHMYRILQELLANTLKHAAANKVSLSFTMHQKALVFMMEDDGRGFDLKAASGGLGLKNVNERATAINAILTIDAIPGKGTHTIIEVPIDNS